MLLSLLILALVALALLGYLLYQNNRSLRQLTRGADRLAKGDLTRKLPVTGPKPVAHLAESLNRMAGQLEDRLSTVVQQRNELEAVLASMAEGVLAVDDQEKLLSLNRAAASLLEIDAARALGRNILEVVRNHALQKFITAALSSHRPVKDELTLRQTLTSPHGEAREGIRRFQAYGTALRDGAGKRIGALVVLHDVTQLRRLESVRQDFVSNASHEMRTPVASIKAAIETVLSDDQADPQDIQRFLKMIERQSNRLQNIIEDMLALARLEQEGGHLQVDLIATPVCQVVDAAVQVCQPKAAEKNIAVEVHAPPHLEVRAHAPMIEQALVNLLDNAVKYSPAGSTVAIDVHEQDREIVLAVVDEGPGIEPEHLPRLFERFYRTDKARSRALGGTGLGLAIVKHIVQAHGGRVSVSSVPGQGSSFRIHLPAAETEKETARGNGRSAAVS